MRRRKWCAVAVVEDGERRDIAKFLHAGDAYRYAADLADRFAEIGRPIPVLFRGPYGSERVRSPKEGGAA